MSPAHSSHFSDSNGRVSDVAQLYERVRAAAEIWECYLGWVGVIMLGGLDENGNLMSFR